jgi:hypothetical protein
MKSNILSPADLSGSARPLKNTGVGLATQIARVLLPLSICIVSTGASAKETVSCKFTHVGEIYASDRFLREYIVDDVWERTGRKPGRGDVAERQARREAERKIIRAVKNKADDECSGQCLYVDLTVTVTEGPCQVNDLRYMEAWRNMGAD